MNNRSAAMRRYYQEHPEECVRRSLQARKKWSTPEFRQKIVPIQKALGYRNYPPSNHVRKVDQEKDMVFFN